jgi:hypothetical protein
MKNNYTKYRFVLQLHKSEGAAGEHMDFRFEFPRLNGLMSFALPKASIPQKLHERRLAVRVSDHSKSWLWISNKTPITIPKGEYGHGIIKTIAAGELYLHGYSDKFITFTVLPNDEYDKMLLKGTYSLIKFIGKRKSDKKDDNWVLIKIQDKEIPKEDNKL